ncbi:hypothetical protein LDENG_00139140 [Lucifuga dentata]|nr:hypothetical protein LDENG_00139140 [Lucifuga dentata]
MEDADVNYASVVFQSGKNPSPEGKKQEETVYDEVKTRSEINEQPANKHAGFSPDGKAANKGHQCRHLACCLGILCVILLSAVIAIVVYQSNDTDTDAEIQLLKINISMLNVQIDNITRERNERNITLAQWSVDAYCLKNKDSSDKQCKACQGGWNEVHYNSSCYAVIDTSDVSLWRSWEEAQEDCRNKGSDLAVIGSQQELNYMTQKIRWFSTSTTSGSWIGLTRTDGKWTWIDGSSVYENFWSEEPPDNADWKIQKEPNYVNAAECMVGKIPATSVTSIISENIAKGLAAENSLLTNIITLNAQIENMMREKNERNITLAQWSVDAYCPKNKEAGKKLKKTAETRVQIWLLQEVNRNW